MSRAVRFDVRPGDGGGWLVVPEVDGVPLTELVEGFERAAAVDVVGGYAGVPVGAGRAGRWAQDVTGAGEGWPGPGTVALLGCECGDVGCWPLLARVSSAGGSVGWLDVEQPHRPARDYAGLGPFDFDAGQYRAAVQDAVTAMGG